MNLNTFVKPDRGRQSLVLADAETRDEAQASGRWYASTVAVTVEEWR